MSSGGRGRGYTGRHHSRARPGDCTEEDAARTLAELSPRATVKTTVVSVPSDRESRDKDKSQETAMPRERERKTSHQELRERESKISHQELRERESKISNQEPRELEPETSDLLDNISSEDDSVLKELLNIDEQFQPLLVLLEQFLPSEDGIQFNRKLRNFETTITNMCPDEIRLQAAFASFRAAALRNPVTARKLAGVGASFTRQQRQQLLRTTLLNVIMQGTFSKLDILERANPVFLINAANLMGDYFSEARLCNGNKVHILASPLLQYMKALLASDDVRAHRSLATQLMQNGRELLAVQQTETEELTIKIRLRLLTPPPCGIVWLLLSSDMALNKFLPLPNCLQQFYASNLKLTSDSDYSEVSYGSWKKSPEEKSDESQNLSHNISNISLMDEDGSSRPRLRPILGAGAGLLKQNLAQDFDWTQKTTLSKRYDLNSWRQEGEKEEPVFDPSVLPPPLVPPNLPRNFSEYPPPNFNYKEQYNNYLQQGDGHYIQQYNYDVFQGPEESEFSELALSERTFPELPMPDRTFPETIQTYPECFQEDVPERATIADFENCDRTIAPDNDKVTDKVNNEIQTSSRKPLENWRRDKTDGKEDPKTWTRQKSKDNVSDDDKERRIKNPARANRRNSDEKSPTRRHVSDVPRNHKYWDHDDRCDKDY